MEEAWLWVVGQVAGWGGFGLVGLFAGASWGVDLKWRGAFGFGAGWAREVCWGGLVIRSWVLRAFDLG